MESVPSKIAARNIPNFNVGDFCRIVKENGPIECVVHSFKDDQVRIISVGFNEKYQVSMKDLRPSSGSSIRLEQEFKAIEQNPKLDWKVGDACRARWSEDQVVYEATISTVDKSEGQDYAFVVFIGYENNDSAWFTQILPSAGPEQREKQRREALGLPEPSEPKEIRKEVSVEPSDSNKPVSAVEDVAKAWKPHSRCRAIRSSDGVEYEATLLEVIESTNSGNVHFVGMDSKHDEIKPLVELKSSLGKVARENQRNEWAKSKLKTTEETEWKVGMPCVAIFSGDGVEYEADIISIGDSEGYPFAVVRFLFYENEESIWLENLLPSWGEQARESQIRTGLGGTIPKKETEVSEEISKTDDIAEEQVHSSNDGQIADQIADQNNNLKEQWSTGMKCRAIFSEDGYEYEGEIISTMKQDGIDYALIRYLGYGNEEYVDFDHILPSSGEEARQSQIVASGAESVATEAKVEDEKVEEVVILANGVENHSWEIGMYCRAFYSEDGLEYEGQIKTIESSDGNQYATVQFLGYGNEEVTWIKDIVPSAGEEARQAQIVASGAEVGSAEVVSTEASAAEVGSADAIAAGVGSSDATAPEVVSLSEAIAAEVVLDEAPAAEVVPPKTSMKIETVDNDSLKQTILKQEVQSPMNKNLEMILSTADLNKDLRGVVIEQFKTHILVNTEEYASHEKLPERETVTLKVDVDDYIKEVFPKKADLKVGTKVMFSATNGRYFVDKKSLRLDPDLLLEKYSNCNGINGMNNGVEDKIQERNLTPVCSPGLNISTSDINNNESPLTLQEAVKLLHDEINAVKTINNLRRQLEMKEEEVRMLRDKINVNDTVVQEIRDTNLQLRNENKRLISSESKSNNNVSQLLDDVRILLSKDFRLGN